MPFPPPKLSVYSPDNKELFLMKHFVELISERDHITIIAKL